MAGWQHDCVPIIKMKLFFNADLFPAHLFAHLLSQCQAGQYGQREDHNGQTVVSQEVDQRAVERLHVVLQGHTQIRWMRSVR